MNDPSVIVAQNERATSQALIDTLKKDGYTVVVEKQLGINDIKAVYAYKDTASAKQNVQALVAMGKDSRAFEIV